MLPKISSKKTATTVTEAQRYMVSLLGFATKGAVRIHVKGFAQEYIVDFLCKSKGMSDIDVCSLVKRVETMNSERLRIQFVLDARLEMEVAAAKKRVGCCSETVARFSQGFESIANGLLGFLR